MLAKKGNSLQHFFLATSMMNLHGVDYQRSVSLPQGFPAVGLPNLPLLRLSFFRFQIRTSMTKIFLVLHKSVAKYIVISMYLVKFDQGAY